MPGYSEWKEGQTLAEFWPTIGNIVVKSKKESDFVTFLFGKIGTFLDTVARLLRMKGMPKHWNLDACKEWEKEGSCHKHSLARIEKYMIQNGENWVQISLQSEFTANFLVKLNSFWLNYRS